jgi:hypothetical protein
MTVQNIPYQVATMQVQDPSKLGRTLHALSPTIATATTTKSELR